MSLKAMQWVWDESESKGGERLTLLAIADCANDKGERAFPSNEELVRKTGLSPNGVRNACKSLRAKGELDWEEGGGRKANLYRISGMSRTPSETEGVENCVPGLQEPTPSPSETDPQPFTPRGGNHHVTQDLTVMEPKDNVRLVFDHWRTVAGKSNRTVLDEPRKKVIKKALANYPVQDVLDAVEGWKHSDFHSGKNEGKKVYNDLTLLLRNASQIEKMRDYTRAARGRETTSRGHGDGGVIDIREFFGIPEDE